MCGIAGVAGIGATDDASVVERMLERLIHRGPDAGGIDRLDGCVLGHRRLSIVDLDHGDQPLHNERHTVSVVANGEIYNHQDVRRRLAGHEWATASDCEAIVHLYEEHGTDLVDHLKGMFAFSLWDADRSRLVLAKDRYGKKPLYWCQRGGRLIFASELGALVEHPLVDCEPDLAALDMYFGLQYVPPPLTAYKGVFSLEPGHVLTFERGTVQMRRYWHPPFERSNSVASFPEAVERVRTAVDEAVRIRLMSDVPLGAFLSGGVDSSAVVSSMARQSSGAVKTFCIGFDESGFDERRYARMVAERWGTDHHEFVVKPNAVEVLPTIVEHHGQPFADSSALPTHYVSELTRSGVTVALSGDGGDEVFGGYERYSAALLADLVRRVPLSPAASALGALARVAPPLRRFAGRAQRFATTQRLPTINAYSRWMSHFTPERKQWLYTPEMLQAVNPHRHEEWLIETANEVGGLDTVNRLSRLDMLTYLPNDILTKVDIASMTHSLEVRCPLLDQDLADLVAPMPSAWKARLRTRKRLLRAAFANDIPDQVMNRPKTGFGVPIGEWFRNDLGVMARELLCSGDSASHRYVRGPAVQSLLDEHRSRSHDHAYPLWNLLIFELWLRRFVERTG